MHFNMQADTGELIFGYVVPDSFTSVPLIRVFSDGEELLVFAANVISEGLVAAGRHETGACAFRIDVGMLPALPDLKDLELIEAETGLLIYRRPRENIIRKKILRLETHLLPLWRLDNALESRFQYFAQGAEKYGRETVMQMFQLHSIESVYVSARILYNNYSFHIDESKFQTIILLQDPHLEIAERFVVLSKLGDNEIEQLGMRRDSLSMRSAIEFAKALPMEDEKALARALRSMPADVAAAFANPVVRQLTTATPDEMPRRGAIATALDLLSSFAIVGLRHEPEAFLHAMGELLGLGSATLPAFPHFPSIAALAAFLKTSGVIDALIEQDNELFHFVAEAYKKALQVS